MGMGPMGIVANGFVHIPNIPKIIAIFNHWDHHSNQGQRLMQWYRHYQVPPSNPRNLHEQQQHHCQQLTMSLCYQLFVHIFSCTNDQLLIIFWQNETQSKEIKIIKCMHYQCRLPNTKGIILKWPKMFKSLHRIQTIPSLHALPVKYDVN